jgi:hypothetical protein
MRVKGAAGEDTAEALKRSEVLQGLLWAEAVKASEARPGPITAIYVESLNQTIDMHGVRVQAGLRSRIPTVIWVGIYALGLLSMAAVGYHSGIASGHRSPTMIALVLAFASVLMLIADLDRSTEGFLTTGQQAMLDLQASMKPQKS